MLLKVLIRRSVVLHLRIPLIQPSTCALYSLRNRNASTNSSFYSSEIEQQLDHNNLNDPALNAKLNTIIRILKWDHEQALVQARMDHDNNRSLAALWFAGVLVTISSVEYAATENRA